MNSAFRLLGLEDKITGCPKTPSSPEVSGKAHSFSKIPKGFPEKAESNATQRLGFRLIPLALDSKRGTVRGSGDESFDFEI